MKPFSSLPAWIPKFTSLSTLILCLSWGAPSASSAEATWTGSGQDGRFLNSDNWDTLLDIPSLSDLLSFPDGSGSISIDDDAQAGQITATSGSTVITLSNDAGLHVNDASHLGYILTQPGANLTLQHASGSNSTVRAAAVEAWGDGVTSSTLTLNTTLTLNGGAVQHPARRANYGIVVGAGGRIVLEEHADVVMEKSDGKAAVRIGETSGENNATGILEVRGGRLQVGSEVTPQGNEAAFQVGDWGSHGQVNQSGGHVRILGSFNVGNQGGKGVYNLSGGKLELGNATSGFLNSLGRNATAYTEGGPVSHGIINLSGTGELEIVMGNLIIGNRMQSTSEGSGGNPTNYGHGEIMQTGGTLRVRNGAILSLSGYGNNDAENPDGKYTLAGGVLEIGGDSLRANYHNTNYGSYEFNLAGGTIRAAGADLISNTQATLIEGTTSTIDTTSYHASFVALSGSGDLNKTGLQQLRLTGGGSSATTWEGNRVAFEGGLHIMGNAALNLTQGATILAHGASEDAMGRHTLVVGNTRNQTGTLNLVEGHLRFELAETGGVEQALLIGQQVAGQTGTFTGVVNLSGNSTITYDDTQADGTTGLLGIGYGAQSRGTLNQSGGSVQIGSNGANTTHIGADGGEGLYHLTNNASYQSTNSGVSIGSGEGSLGTLRISDEATLSAINTNGRAIIIGSNQGVGTITQDGEGSEVLLYASLAIEFGTGSSSEASPTTGTYNLNAGHLQIGSDTRVAIGSGSGNNGVFEQTGGTLLVNQGNKTFTVGEAGNGRFTQTQGTSRFEGTIEIARLSGSQGQVELAGGVMEIGGTNGIQKGAGNASLTLRGGTLKVINSDFSTSVDATIGHATIDTNGYNATLAGVLSDADGATGQLTKDGTGVLTLNGTNHYSGATSINAGRLHVTGTTGTGALTVAQGATLSGTGTIHGAATIAGALDPGASPGTLTFANGLTLASTAQTTLELDWSSGTLEHDVLSVTNGTLTLGGHLTFHLNGLSPSLGSVSFLDAGSITGTLSSVSITGSYGSYTLDLLGNIWTLENDGAPASLRSFTFDQTNGTANYEAIPEPSTWALLLGLGAASLLRRRIKRSS